MKAISGSEEKVMQAQEAMLEQSPRISASYSSGRGIGGLLTRLLGCWHRDMSRPFSRGGHAYRSCLSCGAHRKFNVGRWEMQGEYYYRPA